MLNKQIYSYLKIILMWIVKMYSLVKTVIINNFSRYILIYNALRGLTECVGKYNFN